MKVHCRVSRPRRIPIFASWERSYLCVSPLVFLLPFALKQNKEEINCACLLLFVHVCMFGICFVAVAAYSCAERATEREVSRRCCVLWFVRFASGLGDCSLCFFHSFAFLVWVIGFVHQLLHGPGGGHCPSPWGLEPLGLGSLPLLCCYL